MKIVNIILTSQNGGAEQAFLDYASALKNLGHEILAVIKDDAPYTDKVEELGIEVKKVKNTFSYHDIFTSLSIKKILEEFDADATLSHAGRSIVVTRRAIKKIKHKKIVEIAVNHSMNVKRSIGADIILSVNQPIFFKTIDSGQSPDSSFSIPNAISMKNAIETTSKINLAEKEVITIGVMGRLDEAKGFIYAIKALKELEGLSDKKFKLKIAGLGPQETELRELANTLDLKDKIEFLGWIEDRKEFFTSIDIFCMTSKRETFGLVLLEAMKYRTPIISTDADGPREILTNESDSLIVNLEPEKNIEENLAKSIIRLTSETDLANLFIERSFKKLKEKFSYASLENRLKYIVGSCKKDS